MPDSNIENNEIDLLELIKELVKSKIIIIAIPLVLALLASINTHFIKPEPVPAYTSSVKIIIGSYDKNPILDIGKIKAEIKFYFSNKNIHIDSESNKFLTIKITSPSIETNSSELMKIVDYAVSESQEVANFINQSNVEEASRSLLKINNKIDLLKRYIDKTPEILKTDASVYVYHNTMSQEMDLMEFQKKTVQKELDLVIKNTDFENTKQFGKIESEQIRDLTKSNKDSFLALILGFIVSVAYIFFRFIFKKQTEN